MEIREEIEILLDPNQKGKIYIIKNGSVLMVIDIYANIILLSEEKIIGNSNFGEIRGALRKIGLVEAEIFPYNDFDSMEDIEYLRSDFGNPSTESIIFEEKYRNISRILKDIYFIDITIQGILLFLDKEEKTIFSINIKSRLMVVSVEYNIPTNIFTDYFDGVYFRCILNDLNNNRNIITLR